MSNTLLLHRTHQKQRNIWKKKTLIKMLSYLDVRAIMKHAWLENQFPHIKFETRITTVSKSKQAIFFMYKIISDRFLK